MNGPLLHEYIHRLEAPLRERAAQEAAQRALALRARQQPIGSGVRLALGQALVGIGTSIQGHQAAIQGESAEAAT